MIARLDGFLSDWIGVDRAYAVLRFLAYVGVSGVALVVDVSVFWLTLGLFRYAAAAAGFAFLFGVAAHYLMSSRVAFADVLTRRGGKAEAPVFGQFLIAGGTGLLVTPLIVWAMADVAGFHPLIAKGAAVAVSFVSVFAVMRFLVLGDFLKRPAAA